MITGIRVALGAAVVVALLGLTLYATGVFVPANHYAPHHDHHGSPAHGKMPLGGLSNDYSKLYGINGTDNAGVVYDRTCTNSPAAVQVKNGGSWKLKAIDKGCFGEGAFYRVKSNAEAHRTATYKNGRGNWVWGPTSGH
jgi:hypothetical protein